MSRFHLLPLFLIAALVPFAWRDETLARGDEKPLPPEMVVLRAQPAVFTVKTVSDVELTAPKAISANMPSLEADAPLLRDPPGKKLTTAERYWTLIIGDPAKYLVASPELVVSNSPNVFIGGGTAFAISREGILLTNAHVFSAHAAGVVTEAYSLLLVPSLVEEVERLKGTLGTAEFGADIQERFRTVMYAWYGSKCKFKARFKSAYLVTSYEVDLRKQLTLLAKSGASKALTLAPEKLKVPLTVLAIGEPIPGKDVAVIKAVFEPEEQNRLIARNKQQRLPALDTMLAAIQNDRLVCLPLGNSDDVLPQARVQSLGFPQMAFNPSAMTADAEFKVSSREGQIGQTKRMTGGWDAFEMTAVTRPGDSGGPVLNERGQVVGLNVGAAQNKPDAISLVVPINLAKEMLRTLDIKPNPGELSRHWESGLRLYAAGKYEAALQELNAAEKLQRGDSLPGHEVSYYLKDMRGRCLQKLGKIPAG